MDKVSPDENPSSPSTISVARPVPRSMSVADVAQCRPEDLDHGTPSPDELHSLARYLSMGLSNLIDGWDDRPPGLLRLPKGRIRAARTCPAQVLCELSDEPMNFQLAVGTVCDTAAGILAVHPRFGAEDGWYRSLQAALDQEHPDVGVFVDNLGPMDREDFVHRVDELCLPLPDLLGDLTALRPVTHQRVAATIERVDADESETLDVTLSGEVDIVAGTATQVLVEVKSGSISTRVMDELAHYGLIMALQNERRLRKSTLPTAARFDRSGVDVPVVVGCALTLGDMAVTPVPFTIETLEGAASRVLETVEVLVDLDQATVTGRPAPTRPGPYCRWCRRLDSCAEGSTHVESDYDGR